jgi:hypothetical protein
VEVVEVEALSTNLEVCDLLTMDEERIDETIELLNREVVERGKFVALEGVVPGNEGPAVLSVDVLRNEESFGKSF